MGEELKRWHTTISKTGTLSLMSATARAPHDMIIADVSMTAVPLSQYTLQSQPGGKPYRAGHVLLDCISHAQITQAAASSASGMMDCLCDCAARTAGKHTQKRACLDTSITCALSQAAIRSAGGV